MIDHHVYIKYDKVTYFSLSLEELSNRLDRFGLKGAIIFSFPNISLKDKNPLEEGNKRVLESSRMDRRLIPFMFIHPFLDDPFYIQDNQDSFLGFKLYPKTDGMEYDYRKLSNNFKRSLNRIRKPLLFHTDFRVGHRIRDLIHFIGKIYNPCILSHCRDLIDNDLKIASKLPNTTIDVSSNGCYDRKRNKKLFF